jgi:hypothetical protein
MGAFFLSSVQVGTSVHGTKSSQIELVAMGILIVAGLSRGSFRLRSWERAWWILAFFVGLVAVYEIIQPSTLLSYGTSSHYLKEALIYCWGYALPGIFVAMFYRESLFIEIFRAWVRLSAIVALVAYAISKSSGHLILVSTPGTGPVRLEGFLGEPSAWAPVVAAGLLIAVWKRSRLDIVLLIAVAVFTASPTVYIVTATSIPLYYLVTLTFGKHFRPQRFLLLLLIAVAAPFAVNFLQTANPVTYASSTDQFSITLGRIISGVQNIESNGTTGTNARFASTSQVEADTRTGGLLPFGGGPGTSNVYFPAKYPTIPGETAGLLPNALWVDILFDFGEVGVALLAILLLCTALRIRQAPIIGAILLPFIVASFINSAEGTPLYQFTVLAIFVFVFKWGLPGMTSQRYRSTVS